MNAILPATENGFDKIKIVERKNDEQRKEYKKILETILKVFDPSITSVEESKDTNDAFVLTLENVSKSIIIQDGMKLSLIPYLYSGTKYGINIAIKLFAIKHHINGIYLIDEQFSYVDSDVETSILALLVSYLDENEQIFLTTHNKELLASSFSFHSFYFMKKELDNDKHKISIFCAQKVENRNNVSPKAFIDNDVFSIRPDLSPIFILWGNNLILKSFYKQY